MDKFEINRKNYIFELKNIPKDILRFQKYNKKLTAIERMVSVFLIDCINLKFISGVKTQQIIKLDDRFIIVDFFIEKPGLIIEVDGPEHDEKWDAHRDKRIKETFDYTVVRIKNKDMVDQNREMRNKLLTTFANLYNTNPQILKQSYWSKKP